MINRIIYSLTGLLVLMFAGTLHGEEKNIAGATAPLNLEVYKTPTCGCCKKWIDHIHKQGFEVSTIEFTDLTEIKSKFNILPNFRSCHTAISNDGFIFEGHIPAKFIQQFLSEDHPNALGLAVPAMPLGSPGMEVGERFMPYTVLVLLADGSSQVYAQVDSYKDQF